MPGIPSIPWFIITYDLNRPGQDYKDLIPMLKNTLKAHPMLESVWILPTSTLSAKQICDILTKPNGPLDKNDGLVIGLIEDPMKTIAINTETEISKIPLWDTD